MAIGVTPTARATRRIETAAAPSATRMSFAAATTRAGVDAASLYTPYASHVYTVDGTDRHATTCRDARLPGRLAGWR